MSLVIHYWIGDVQDSRGISIPQNVTFNWTMTMLMGDDDVYDFSDYTQVHTVTKYVARDGDELSLEEADVISVYHKSPDGST